MHEPVRVNRKDELVADFYGFLKYDIQKSALNPPNPLNPYNLLDINLYKKIIRTGRNFSSIHRDSFVTYFLISTTFQIAQGLSRLVKEICKWSPVPPCRSVLKPITLKYNCSKLFLTQLLFLTRTSKAWT